MNDKIFKSIFPFPSPRKFQREIVEIAIKKLEEGKKYLILNAPTAIGKSPIAVAITNYFGNGYFLTSQKVLQDQYTNDYVKHDMLSIKGRSNYQCSKSNNKLKCDYGICKKTKSKFPCKDCTYLNAREDAYNSKLMITNYRYFLNMSEFQKQNKRNILVCDEAHNVESELLSYASVTLSIKDFKYNDLKGLLKFPSVKMNDLDKFKWLYTKALPIIIERLKLESATFEDYVQNDPNFYKQSRKIKYLDTIMCMINRMKLQYDKGIGGIVQQNYNYDIDFKLLKGAIFANDYLFKFAEKVILMSATIFSKKQICNDLGINEDEVCFINCPSPIPIKQRPIYDMANINLSFKERDKSLPILSEKIKTILNNHKNERGIIHTVNFKIAEYIVETLKDDRLVLPRGFTRNADLENFKTSKRQDLVLISPSLTEGISLDNDLSRFTIICKLPFGNLGDKWIKARMDLDNAWYTINTVQSLVQMTGRSVRSPEDSATAYVLDSSFKWFFRQNKNLFPKWWRNSIIR